jgi:hypothetical protein
LYIKFNHSPIYGGTKWNENKTKPSLVKSNILKLDLSQTTISNILSVTASKGVVTDGNPEDLILIPLDEPAYGKYENSRVSDFDLEYADKVSSTSTITSLGPNFTTFYKRFSEDYDLGELLPEYIEPEKLEKLDENWELIPGSEVVETKEPDSIWSTLANLAKLVTSPFTSGNEETEEEKIQKEKARAVLAPMTPEQIENQEQALRKSREQESRKLKEAQAKAESEKAQKAERNQLKLLASSSSTGSDDAKGSNSDSQETGLTEPYNLSKEKVIDRRRERSKSERLAKEEKTLRNLEAGELAQIKKIEDDAITYRFDLIIKDLESQSRRFKKLGLNIEDVEILIKKAAVGKIFSKYSNKDMVEFILKEQVDDKIEEIAKAEKSSREKYLKYKAKYLKLKELLN